MALMEITLILFLIVFFFSIEIALARKLALMRCYLPIVFRVLEFSSVRNIKRWRENGTGFLSRFFSISIVIRISYYISDIWFFAVAFFFVCKSSNYSSWICPAVMNFDFLFRIDCSIIFILFILVHCERILESRVHSFFCPLTFGFSHDNGTKKKEKCE